MGKIMWYAWPWLTLLIFACLVSVILRLLMNLVIVGWPGGKKLPDGNVGVDKLLLISLFLGGVVCVLLWLAVP